MVSNVPDWHRKQVLWDVQRKPYHRDLVAALKQALAALERTTLTDHKDPFIKDLTDSLRENLEMYESAEFLSGATIRKSNLTSKTRRGTLR